MPLPVINIWTRLKSQMVFRGSFYNSNMLPHRCFYSPRIEGIKLHPQRALNKTKKASIIITYTGFRSKHEGNSVSTIALSPRPVGERSGYPVFCRYCFIIKHTSLLKLCRFSQPDNIVFDKCGAAIQVEYLRVVSFLHFFLINLHSNLNGLFHFFHLRRLCLDRTRAGFRIRPLIFYIVCRFPGRLLFINCLIILHFNLNGLFHFFHLRRLCLDRTRAGFRIRPSLIFCIVCRFPGRLLFINCLILILCIIFLYEGLSFILLGILDSFFCFFLFRIPCILSGFFLFGIPGIFFCVFFNKILRNLCVFSLSIIVSYLVCFFPCLIF